MPRARKSKITRLPAEQRAYIEKLMREDRLTLDEMLAAIRTKFPTAEVSRSGLHRFALPLRELTERMREIDTAARVVVEELGENPDDRAGALLCQSITTLATNAALRAQVDDETSIEDVRKLARASKDVISARAASLKERQAIEQAAREKLVREQRDKLDALGKSGAVSPEVLAVVMKAAYDL